MHKRRLRQQAIRRATRKRYATRRAVAMRKTPRLLTQTLSVGLGVYLTANDKARLENTCAALHKMLLHPAERELLAAQGPLCISVGGRPCSAKYAKLARARHADPNVACRQDPLPLSSLCAHFESINPQKDMRNLVRHLKAAAALIARGATFARRGERCDEFTEDSMLALADAAIIVHPTATPDDLCSPSLPAYSEVVAAFWTYASCTCSVPNSLLLNLAGLPTPREQDFFENPALWCFSVDNWRGLKAIIHAKIHLHPMPNSEPLFSAALAWNAPNCALLLAKLVPDSLICLDEFGRLPVEKYIHERWVNTSSLPRRTSVRVVNACIAKRDSIALMKKRILKCAEQGRDVKERILTRRCEACIYSLQRLEAAAERLVQAIGDLV